MLNQQFYPQKITNYYANHKTAEADNLDSLSALALGRDWSVRRVVWIKKQDEIHESIRKLTDARRGTPRYLGYYQSATTLVINEMSEDELEEIERTVEEWKTKGPPEPVQQE